MDLSHGHPPSLSSRSGRCNKKTFHRDTDPTTPSLLSTQHSDPPFSLQNRRLHLRNVGFRGTKVSSHRLGIKISKFFNGSEIPQSESAPLRNQENTSSQNRSTHSLRGDQCQSTTLSILQEVSNSTRSRSSQKRPDIPIAEDNPERSLVDVSPAATTPGSWYHDASSKKQSPFNFHTTDAEFDTMRLREISGNERGSPAPRSSPLSRQVRSRKKRGLDAQKTTFEASEYIKHIENELQQVKEAMHSPNTGKPLQDKLKMVRAENMQLKDTICELEETFDERLKQAVEYKAAVEVNMRKKIKALEDELITKENKISNLEHDRDESNYDGGIMDALRAMIDRLGQEKERLEEANRVVEKRNEALTGLLAQSPTRSHYGFELTSPIRQDSRRTPRPKSMMIPRLASSPHPENHQRPQSVQISPARSSTSYFSPNTVLRLEHDHPCPTVTEMDPQKTSDSESLDSGLGESCSARSLACDDSRRSSIASHASTSPSAWVLPLPTSPPNDKATVKQNKHRRTRRFESGSTQLKPLLLPTMAAESNAFQMSYALSPHSSPTRREFSGQSLDPTISFISQPFETPVRRPILQPKWVSETALKALEGSPEPQFETFEDIIARHDFELTSFVSSPISLQISDHVHDEKVQEVGSPISANDTTIEDDVAALLNHPESRATEEETFSSLNAKASFTAPHKDGAWSNKQDLTSSSTESMSMAPFELLRPSDNGQDSDDTPLRQFCIDSSRELMPEPLFILSALNRTVGAADLMSQRASFILVSGNVDESPIPRKRQRSSDPDSCSFVMPTLCVNPAHEGPAHGKPSCDIYVGPFNASTDATQRTQSGQPPRRLRNPLETVHKTVPSPIPLTSVTIRTIFGTLSRYTSYVREIRQDPTALARRVIANAWHSNWKRLGRLSWWVLGLFLGPGPRTERLDRADSTGWDWDRYDAEAVADAVCGSEIGATEQGRNNSSQQPSRRASGLKSVRFEESDLGYRTAETKSKAKPALKQDNQDRKKQKSNWRKSLYLWGKFSIAIMLAVGGAVINGPEEMLRDCAEKTSRKTATTIHEPQNRKLPTEQDSPASAYDIPVTEMGQPEEACQASVTEPKLWSEARTASDETGRLFSGTGVGPALGVSNAERNSPKTPSLALQRRRAAVCDLTASKRYAFGAPCGNEGGNWSDGNGCGQAGKTTTRSHGQCSDNILSAQPDEGKGNLGTLQWVQNLDATDFHVADDTEEAVQFHSESGNKTFSLTN